MKIISEEQKGFQGIILFRLPCLRKFGLVEGWINSAAVLYKGKVSSLDVEEIDFYPWPNKIKHKTKNEQSFEI
ncbi:MAG: hypothetical protein AB1480_09705 [Nitrospirota bacterium]